MAINKFQATAAAAAFVACMSSGIASAASVGDVAVTGVGSQGTQLYATLSVTPPGCRGAIVYGSLAGQDSPYVMSLLLTARASHMPLRRIDYAINPDGSCWIQLVEI